MIGPDDWGCDSSRKEVEEKGKCSRHFVEQSFLHMGKEGKAMLPLPIFFLGSFFRDGN